MISYQEALNIILHAASPLGGEQVSFDETLNRVLAEDLFADSNLPPFPQSAMDGYALIADETKGASETSPLKLRVIGTIGAGHTLSRNVERGQAVRIMTGAPIPQECNAVIKIEETETTGEEVILKKPLRAGENVIPKGRDLSQGDLILRKGDLVKAGGIGMLATLGNVMVNVIRRPNVALLALGDELLYPDEPLAPGKIRVSNLYTLAARVKQCGAIPLSLGIAHVRLEDIQEKLQTGLDADIIITIGGSQRGDYDLVDDLLEALGCRILFREVAVNYGRSSIFSQLQGKLFFGLPGSPLTSLVVFEQFVRPAIWKMGGRRDLKGPEVQAMLEIDLKLNRVPGRTYFIPLWVTSRSGQLTAIPLETIRPGTLPSAFMANGIFVYLPETPSLKAGDSVTVELLDDLSVL
ncbi:MAG: molybdopterin molybdotransferase MoeA [Candidatus Tectomicrobia bacterium]|nr:molybdopterin molybdotransferase MoeA [Candidatus Tectomicrobia bacterium]